MTKHAKWPAHNAEAWAPARIKVYAKNARTHTAEQVAAARRAIDEYGWTMPLLVDEKGELIAGHRRFAASQLNPAIALLPVIVAKGWSEEQKKSYRIWDNKSTIDGGWDEGLLRAEIGELKDMGFDLSLVGFSMPELGELGVPGFTLDERMTKAEETPEPPAKPVVRAGELWLLGDHRLLCGDSTKAADVARLLKGGAAIPNLMATDPPYGVEYDPTWREKVDNFKRHARGKVQNDDRADWTAAWGLFEGNIAYVWHGGLHTSEVQDSLQEAGFAMRAQIIWVKQHFVFSRGDYHWKHEPCWYAVRKGAKGTWAADRKQTTVWEIQNHNPMGGKSEGSTGHGTQKPIECMRRPILNNSKRGDAVYDPFVGSGTTLIAAEMEGRRCYAMELAPEYVEVVIRRWENFTSKTARREDGKTLADLVDAGDAKIARKRLKALKKNQPVTGKKLKAALAAIEGETA